MIKKSSEKTGFSVIEILIVVFIITIGLSSILNFATASLRNSTLSKEANQANTIAQETVEIVRNFRDMTTWNVNGLGVLTNGTEYYPQQTGSPVAWQMVSGTQTMGIFTRKIVFYQVQRSATNDDIVISGGVVDPETKKAEISVSWKGKEIKVTSYFTNWAD